MTHVEGRFEWDTKKAEVNFAKHGISFADATEIFDGTEVMVGEPRTTDGEMRHMAAGYLEGLLLIVTVFTERDDRIRIISARPASRKERKRYEERNSR